MNPRLTTQKREISAIARIDLKIHVKDLSFYASDEIVNFGPPQKANLNQTTCLFLSHVMQQTILNKFRNLKN